MNHNFRIGNKLNNLIDNLAKEGFVGEKFS